MSNGFSVGFLHEIYPVSSPTIDMVSDMWGRIGAEWAALGGVEVEHSGDGRNKIWCI
jgi:hypothetical protein